MEGAAWRAAMAGQRGSWKMVRAFAKWTDLHRIFREGSDAREYDDGGRGGASMRRHLESLSKVGPKEGLFSQARYRVLEQALRSQ